MPRSEAGHAHEVHESTGPQALPWRTISRFACLLATESVAGPGAGRNAGGSCKDRRLAVTTTTGMLSAHHRPPFVVSRAPTTRPCPQRRGDRRPPLRQARRGPTSTRRADGRPRRRPTPRSPRPRALRPAPPKRGRVNQSAPASPIDTTTTAATSAGATTSAERIFSSLPSWCAAGSPALGSSLCPASPSASWLLSCPTDSLDVSWRVSPFSTFTPMTNKPAVTTRSAAATPRRRVMAPSPSARPAPIRSRPNVAGAGGRRRQPHPRPPQARGRTVRSAGRRSTRPQPPRQ